MLSKEKINKQAELYINVTDKIMPANSFVTRERDRAFQAGATWASEQYAGVVIALEAVILAYEKQKTPTMEFSAAMDFAQSQLHKLKQP